MCERQENLNLRRPQHSKYQLDNKELHKRQVENVQLTSSSFTVEMSVHFTLVISTYTHISEKVTLVIILLRMRILCLQLTKFSKFQIQVQYSFGARHKHRYISFHIQFQLRYSYHYCDRWKSRFLIIPAIVIAPEIVSIDIARYKPVTVIVPVKLQLQFPSSVLISSYSYSYSYSFSYSYSYSYCYHC